MKVLLHVHEENVSGGQEEKRTLCIQTSHQTRDKYHFYPKRGGKLSLVPFVIVQLLLIT